MDACGCIWVHVGECVYVGAHERTCVHRGAYGCIWAARSAGQEPTRMVYSCRPQARRRLRMRHGRFVTARNASQELTGKACGGRPKARQRLRARLWRFVTARNTSQEFTCKDCNCKPLARHRLSIGLRGLQLPETRTRSSPGWFATAGHWHVNGSDCGLGPL